jgi:hypothetical protein
MAENISSDYAAFPWGYVPQQPYMSRKKLPREEGPVVATDSDGIPQYTTVDYWVVEHPEFTVEMLDEVERYAIYRGDRDLMNEWFQSGKR